MKAIALLLFASAVFCQNAPIDRRFEVRRTDGSFAVVGFRAAAGESRRFVVTTGLTARQALEQLRSVAWNRVAVAPTATQPTEYVVSRSRRADAVESLGVSLNAPQGRVWRVAYAVEPAQFSRKGLARFLRSAFGATPLTTHREDRLAATYTGDDGVTLQVNAVGLDNAAGTWRMTYRIEDASLAPRPAAPSTQPPAGATTRPVQISSTTRPAGRTPAETLRGWKIITPPSSSRPVDGETAP